MPNTLRILLVDDEPNNLDLLERALLREGHACFRANTGEEALDIFAREIPDLVLMDVMLPGIDGFETTRRIRKHKTKRWIPIIFLSALDQSVDVVTGLDAGGDDYMTKPVDLSVLKAKIEAGQRFVELHRQIEEQSDALRRYYDNSEQDKHLAAEMMKNMRRENQPQVPGLEHSTIAAVDVSGDLIAANETPDGRLHLMLADATGHGLIAAINLLPAVEAFYAMTAIGHSMPYVIQSVNDALRNLIPGHRFVSALFATLDPMTSTIEVWNAGVPAALLTTSQGELVHRFESKFIPLGITSIVPEELEGESVPMAPGQTLVAFSDGLIEAENRAGQPFDESRLLGTLPQAIQANSCAGIMQALREFTGSSVFADDVSVLIARQSPPLRLKGGQRCISVPPSDYVAAETGITMIFGPKQLHRLGDITPHFMNISRNHCDLPSAAYARIFRVVQHLTCNAVQWGLLQLPAEIASLPLAQRRERRKAALGSFTEGKLTLSLLRWKNAADQCAWEVIVEDSGSGFDGPAALAQAYTKARPGGLAQVADEAMALVFEPARGRVRAWVVA